MKFEFSHVLASSFDDFDSLEDGDYQFIDENYSNIDYGSIVSGVGQVAGSISGAVSSSKQAKEMAKGDLEKYVQGRCGKDKSRAILKNKRNTYLACRKEALAKWDEQKQATIRQSEQQTELALKMASAKQKTNITLIIVVATLVTVAGVVIYIKNKK
jgi:hypothetical protein